MATRPRQTKGEATRQRILTTSIKAFARQGFSGTRLDDIARELGVTRQTLLFHFKDKLGLYDAALESLLADAESFTPPVPRAQFPSLHAYVRHLVHSTVTFHLQLPEFARISNQFLLNPAPGAENTSPGVARMVLLWQQVLDEGKASGLTRHEVSLHSVIALVGGMMAYYSLLPEGRQASSALRAQAPGEKDIDKLSSELLHAVEGLLGLAPEA